MGLEEIMPVVSEYPGAPEAVGIERFNPGHEMECRRIWNLPICQMRLKGGLTPMEIAAIVAPGLAAELYRVAGRGPAGMEEAERRAVDFVCGWIGAKAVRADPAAVERWRTGSPLWMRCPECLRIEPTQFKVRPLANRFERAVFCCSKCAGVGVWMGLSTFGLSGSFAEIFERDEFFETTREQRAAIERELLKASE